MAKQTWNEAKAAALVALREAYLAELELLAEQLRPRFQSGELRGFTDEDLEHEGEDETWRAPLWRLEDACAEHFGLNEEPEVWDEAYCAALFIRSVAPGDSTTEDGQPNIGQAVGAVACDVVAVARARGWYTPAEDECPSLDATRWALEAA